MLKEKLKLFPLLYIFSLIISVVSLVILIDSYNKIHTLKNNLQSNINGEIEIQKEYSDDILID